MASDSDYSRRKNRRSASDEDVEKSSKRHKHRHHRSHHRHRHRSSKRDEKTGHEADKIDLPDSIPLLASNGNQLDDELEEGEILEDACLDKEESVTKVEKSNSTENEAEETHRQPDEPNLVLSDGGASRSNPIRSRSLREENIDQGLSHTLTLDKDDKIDHFSGKSQTGFRAPRNEGFDSQSQSNVVIGCEGLVNGDLGLQSRKGSHMKHRESCSPYKENVKRKSYQDEEKPEVDGGRSKRSNNSSSESTDDRYEPLVHSPSYKERLLAAHGSIKSRSNGRSRERSHSRGLVQEEVWSNISRHTVLDTSLYVDKSKTEDNLDERMPLDSKEDSKSYDRDRRSKDREIARDSKKVIDRTGVRDRERDRYNREEKERDMSRDMEQNKYEIEEKDRDRSRDRKRETYLDRNGEYGADKYRRRENERGRSRDRGLDRDSYKEKEREWSSEKFRSTDRDRYQEKEKEKRREQDWIRGREKEWEKERDRGRREGRSREIDRDIESDREKYAHFQTSHRNQDWHKHSRQTRHERSEYSVHEIRRLDSKTQNNSKINSFEGDKNKLIRDQDREEDYEETVELKVVDEEEEDLNRIKEESKRRRLAILEKYKKRQLDSEVQPLSEEMKTDNKSAEGKGSVSAVPEIVDGLDDYVADSSFAVEKMPSENAVSTSGRNFGARGLGEGTPKSERSAEILFDDIFGDTPTAVRKTQKGDGLQIERSGLHDNWDDADGYYSYQFGEVFNGRYEVTAAHGKGVFSTVVRAKNLKTGNGEPEEVAIKILRSNETMYKAGLEELVILKKLVGADPDDKRHCVRFLSSFKYRNHLCLVFESLHMNLREVLKKFGRNIGLKLTAVRAYAKQLFISLKHLKNCGVLHCDIKPDNMLVNEGKNVLKLCDFGNAMFAGKNEITPYLVSRFYRAPEIILGLPYDHPMDIWSVGCCLYELYTGKVLFPGSTNNDMLRLHMELKGPFPKKMLRRGGFTDQHFDQDLNFHATEEDPVTKKAIKRIIVNIKPKEIGSIVTGSSGEDPKMITNFKDLLDKIFVLDPDKRMTVSQALSHPFITGK